LLVFGGAVMTVSNATANTLLQRTAEPLLRGETASLYMLAMRGGRSLGDLFAGLTVSTLGIREALLLNGVLAVAVQSYIAHAWNVSARASKAAANIGSD